MKRPQLIAACLAVAGVLSCDLDGDDAAPPAGRQIVRGRDVDNLLRRGGTWLFTRSAQIPDTSRPFDLWRWDDTGDPFVAVANLDSAPEGAERWLARGDFLLTGPQATSLYHLPTNTVIPTGVIATRAFSSDGAMLAYQVPGSPSVAVIHGAGRTDIAGLEVKAFDFSGADLVVFGHPSGTATFDGIYRVTLPDGVVTPVLPAIVDPSWTRAADSFQVIGCEPCGAAPAPCHVVTSKPSADAGDVYGIPVAYDVSSGAELTLPGRGPATRFAPSLDRRAVAWQDVEQDGSAGATHYWDVCGGHQGACSIPGADVVAWSSDADHFAAFAQAASGRQLGVVSISQQTCVLPAAGVGADSVGFSPAGDRMAWFVKPRMAGDPPRTLWLASATGEDPRPLVVDERLVSRFFSGDGARLFLQREVDNRRVLSWIELADADLTETPLPGAFGSFNTGRRRLLITADWNDQDGSGTLQLVDFTGGASSTLATSVPLFLMGGPVDDASLVTYTVRKRFESADDGLWVTTLPP
jgi:hypothetical protein